MRYLCLQSPLRTLVFTALIYLLAPAPAHAQSPYLYASLPGGGATSQIVGFSVALDGTLIPISGSPFNLSREGGLVTTDPDDQFLFVLNATSNTISVLAISQNTGALTEVSGSPVAAPTPPPGSGSAPSGPLCMATFKNKGASASYLYVAYRNGPAPFTGAIVAFQIGTESQPLAPIATITLEATPVDMTISPQGNLYAALQLVPGSTLGNQTPGLAVFPIDPNSGQLGQPNPLNSNLHEDSLALNPGATILFDGEGSSAAGFIESAQVRTDGSVLAPHSLPVVSPNSPPSTILVDGSGQLLYVQQGGQAAVYTIDKTTGILSAPSTSPAPVPFNLGRGNTVAHPVEPYLYTVQSGGQIHVFEVTDSTSGALRELGDSPYTVAGAEGSGGLALSHNAAAQTAAPLAAQLVPSEINFVDTTLGQSVSDNSALLTNTGTQALNMTVSITGADRDDFSTTTCPSPLATRTSCPITVTFTPTQAGARQATLVVADSAGPQTLQLTGIGVSSSSSGSGSGPGGSGGSGSGSGSGSGGSGGSGSGGTGGSGGSGGSGNPSAQPTISISPLSTFVSPALNTVAPPQNITLTNNSSPTNSPASLQISSLQIIGPNATDFALTTGCPSSYPSGQRCTLGIVFTPSASGSRFATLVVTDNAVNSPQLIELSGVTQAETLTISPRPESNGSGYSQTVSAGETANFPLLLSTTFSGTVFFSPCSGAPVTATCTPPTPMTVVANQPMTFSVSVNTVAASPSLTLLDELMHYRRRTGPSQITPSPIPLIVLTTACAFILLRRRRTSRHARLSHSPHNSQYSAPHVALRPFAISASATTTLAAFLALTILTISGCGGASTVATATTVTPTSASQTYTIVITPTAVTSDNSSVPNVQPIQLTLIVN
jgi:Abnormal spindle-like microcephaly-assoc'd, ASPM-SPD-2-Hydin/Lactonase, 7-bladed beta-propeller